MTTSTSFAPRFSSPSCLPRVSGIDPFAARYGKSLPRDLRIESAGMSWISFESRYAPSSGPFRLGRWSDTKVGPGMWHFEATLGIGESIATTSARAPGPISAMTAMLCGAGCSMEILSFHQQRIAEGAATFLLCESADGVRRWSMGIGGSDTESALRAMIACANRLTSTE